MSVSLIARVQRKSFGHLHVDAEMFVEDLGRTFITFFVSRDVRARASASVFKCLDIESIRYGIYYISRCAKFVFLRDEIQARETTFSPILSNDAFARRSELSVETSRSRNRATALSRNHFATV